MPCPERAPVPGADPRQRRLVRRGLPERLAERAEVPEVGVDADGRAGEHGDGRQQREQDPRSATGPHPRGAERDEHADDEQYRADRPPRAQREAREQFDHVRPVRSPDDPRQVSTGVARRASRRRRPPSARATRPNRHREEALGAGVEQPDPRQVGPPPVGQHPGQPLGAELGVEVVQRLDLEERVEQPDHPPGDPLARRVNGTSSAKSLPHIAKFIDSRATPRPRRVCGRRGDEELGHAVGRVRVVAHEVERVAERRPVGGHDPQEAPGDAVARRARRRAGTRGSPRPRRRPARATS